MFRDYVTLMLVNVSAGLLLAGLFLILLRDVSQSRHWSPALASVGLVLLISGLHMSFTWPLPGSHNTVFGENSVLLGTVLLTVAGSLSMAWSLAAPAILAIVASLVPLAVGTAVLVLHASGQLHFTAAPALTGISFIASGAGGLLGGLGVLLNRRKIRMIGGIVLVISAAAWAFMGISGDIAHLGFFKDYAPLL